MSNRYKGAVISATPPTTTGGESGTASGAWTLEQQMQLQAAGLWPSPPPPNYIENVFQTWLYTGTSSAQTITNNINLSGKGGLVWLKSRDDTGRHILTDTVRGATKYLVSSSTGAELTEAGFVTSFNSNGFSIGADSEINAGTQNYVSWTFREQPKFFDIVTYTGTGSVQNISHNLGSVPGCIIVKTINAAANWIVQHRSAGGGTQRGILNNTGAFGANSTMWDNTNPTSSVFTVGTNADTNQAGNTFVAYLFAHDAGGFGLTETDNVISCGSYTGAYPSTVSVNLGYEPQFVMVKNITTPGYNWLIQDNMRGMPNSQASSGWAALFPNTTGAESNFYALISPTSTGFIVDQNLNGSGMVNTSGDTYIYIAIRRGPMAVPTVGTSVFEPVAYTGTGTNNRIITSSITPDSVIPAQRNDTASKYWYDRLRGNGTYLITTGTNAEGTDGAVYGPQFNKVQTGYQQGTSDSGFLNSSTLPTTYINYLLKRAPSFFDEVCYTGTGVARTVAHNLTVVPELMIVKVRNDAQVWQVYSATTGNAARLQLNTNDSVFTVSAIWNTTTPTSSVFSIGTNQSVNGLGSTYVAYLFATCAGVSKVGSYTGNAGYTVTVPCGFTAGVRFVLIKRTDSTGDWYVWDSARGIVAGNDPYLLLNSTAAEVTGTDYVDTYAAGFEVTSTAPAGLNATGGTYIFLAIA